MTTKPVRFEAELSDSLQKDFPEGLNSQHDFHFVFVDIDMIDEESLATMRRLQPKAKFVFMCNSIDLAKAMKRFSLTVRKAVMGSTVLMRTEREHFGPSYQSRFPVQCSHTRW